MPIRGGLQWLRCRHPAHVCSDRTYHNRGTDPYEPDLGVRVPSQKRVRRGEFVLTDTEVSGVNINGNNPAWIDAFYFGTYLPLVKLISSAGEFFDGVTQLADRHFL